MREILFRGKRLDNGEWIYGNLFVPDIPDAPVEICTGTNRVRITYEVDPDTVGQYTGLTDKNRKPVFEDDICKDGWGNNCAVKFGRVNIRCCGCCYDYHDAVGFFLAPKNGRGDCDADGNVWDYVEVIGNIHDNPELVEVSE